MSQTQTQGFQVQTQTVTQAEGIERIVDVDLTNIHVVDMYPIPNALRCVIRYAIARKYGVEYKPCELLLRQAFDNEIQFRVFKSIPFRHLYKIMFNEHYVQLLTFLPHYRHRCYSDNCNWISSYTVLGFIVGLMSNDKLFIHQVVDDFRFLNDYDTLPYDKDVELVFMPSLKDLRDYFFNSLGYMRDIELDPETPSILNSGDQWTFVRVQGDITLSVHDADIEGSIRERIRNQVERIALLYVVRRLQDMLLDYGVTSAINNLTLEIPMWKIPRDPDLRDNFAEKLREFMAYLVKSDDTINKLLGDTIVITVDLPRHRDDHNIWVTPNFVFGKSIIDTPFFNEIHSIVVREFLNHKGKYTVNFGRHRIDYEGYPQRLTTVIDHEIVGRIAIDVVFAENEFIANEVLLTHPEHEPFYWKWDVPRHITVGNVNNQSINRENYFALTLALKKWENEKKLSKA